ncbi:MAG: LPS-assembly protein LptD, partial [Alphaproteobacteria bacterium]
MVKVKKHRRNKIAQRLAIALAMMTFGSGFISAQEKATLIADLLEITASDTLYAKGNVEILHGGMRLMASSIIYDRGNNSLFIQGPIRLDDGHSTIVLASQAELSDDLRNGLILGAQVIIDSQLQVTSGAMQRVDGRYNAMYQAAASSCKVCDDSAPLWEIRAKRIVHDAEQQRIFLDHAQFRVGGVPLAYFPKLQLPDPTLQRATGFLVPRIEASSKLGFGLKTPYFVNISPSKDVLLTPYFTTTGTRSLQMRYRQAFRPGTLNIEGALSQDEVVKGKLRGYVLATGQFDLPQGYNLRLRGETVSDPNYFSGYGLTEQDRFVTSLQVDRADRDVFMQSRVLGFYSIRPQDENITQPSQIADFMRSQRFDLGVMGEAQLTAFAQHRQRAS